MPIRTSTLFEDLIVTANRLTRLAAQATGTTTPAAIWRTLSILTTDGSMRIGELATASRVTQPTMTKLVNTLAEDELIDRFADDTDSRASRIAITPKGTTALLAWRTELGEALAPMFADLSADDTETLENAVRILAKRTTISNTVISPSTPKKPNEGKAA